MKGAATGSQVRLAAASGPRAHQITGIVLAGGRGQRFDGRDKGLLRVQGRPLAACVAERLHKQVAALLIVANRNLSDYAALGHRVVSDRFTGFQGPLAGIHAGLVACATDYALVVPCDMPFLPPDLGTKLAAALDDATVAAALACANGQRQPLCLLVRRSVLADLEHFLAGGQRQAMAWLAALAAVEVDFGADGRAFANVNDAAALSAAEAEGGGS